MTATSTLLSELQKLVRDLKPTLLDRLREHPEIDEELRTNAFGPIEKAGRTAQAYEVWREDYLEQVAVAWVLACVFVRYLEDNGLIAEAYLAGGDPDRRRRADDAYAAYFQANPKDSDREYLLHVFRQVGEIPAAAELFAEGRTPLWAVGPTGDGARLLLDFWRKVDPETGELLRSLRAEGGGTRLLGDLYQDLSEAARKKYALLQTPEFVEEFILDHTLTPAIAEFGLEHVRLIDPTCGSGHFLIGAFRRLFAERSVREPATEPEVLAGQILEQQVAGVDLNPFAVAIARFRLVVEAMHACGRSRLREAPGWRPAVVVGDSLMHGDKFDRRGHDEGWFPGLEPWADPRFALDDPDGLARVLKRQYHAVVGNPPYISVKDAKVNERYRRRWDTCHRQYSLGVPFTERFFNLALAADGPRPAGFVGMITANSFMKREFGKKLIEAFLPGVDLTHVIDTSGAHIPEHGTPTVILFGRNRRPVGEDVRAVLGIRGEPSTPEDPAQGLVWRSIVDHLSNGKAQNDFVSVTDVERTTFCKHPWSIGGGGAAELKVELELDKDKLVSHVDLIGLEFMTRADDIYFTDRESLKRAGIQDKNIGDDIEGDAIRDWSITAIEAVLFPYGDNLRPEEEDIASPLIRFLWPCRAVLWTRREPNGDHRQIGLTWYEWSRFQRERFQIRGTISFSKISTHNNFALERKRRLFNCSAPIIKLLPGSSEEEHLTLLGLLNSSTACFWMKQVFHPKGGSGIGRGVQDEAWEMRYEYDGTKMQLFPVVDDRKQVLTSAFNLDDLARRIFDLCPAELVKREVPTAEQLESNRQETERLQAKMVALQEELDWLCYRLYGLMEPYDGPGYDEPYPDPPGLRLGERAFEIALARRVEAGEEQTAWFERHGSTPITDPPEHWPDDYRTLVARRAAHFRDDFPNVALIERPEYKRRWLREPWDDQVRRALRSWLLDRLESGRYRPDPASEPPALTTTARLAEVALRDPEFLRVAALYRGRDAFDVAALVAELVAAESVPFLPVLRYKPSGRLKRAVWERVWDLQRREDAGTLDPDRDGPIPVPPKYASADFLSPDSWRLRGKLDVPRERWVSYPHCERDGDPTLVVGWAGWDHLQQATALASYYDRLKTRDGWPPDRLVPLLAGLDQLVPWLLQWHNDVHPEFDLRMGDYYRDFLRDEAQALGLTVEQIRAWEPPAKARGGRGRKKS